MDIANIRMTCPGQAKKPYTKALHSAYPYSKALQFCMLFLTLTHCKPFLTLFLTNFVRFPYPYTKALCCVMLFLALFVRFSLHFLYTHFSYTFCTLFLTPFVRLLCKGKEMCYTFLYAFLTLTQKALCCVTLSLHFFVCFPYLTQKTYVGVTLSLQLFAKLSLPLTQHKGFVWCFPYALLYAFLSLHKTLMLLCNAFLYTFLTLFVRVSIFLTQKAKPQHPGFPRGPPPWY